MIFCLVSLPLVQYFLYKNTIDIMPHKSVLLTGSEGFLGKRLRKELESKGVAVRGYDTINGEDILNREQFEAAVTSSNATCVIHLAAVADLNIMAKDPELGKRINIDGTKLVLDVCEKFKIRLLFASTCCVYGNNGVHPSSEKAPPAPTEVYAISKLDGEKLIQEVGAPHTILRLATFYGPGMRPALATAIFLEKAHNQTPIHIHGSGNQTRTYTHVEDVANGIITVMQSEEHHPIVNISVSKSYSVLDLAKISMEVVGKKVDLVHIEDRNGQIYKESIDDSLLRSLGWVPKYDLFDGMKHSYEAYVQKHA